MDGLLPDAVRLRPAKARFESLIVDCLSGPDRAAVWGILTDPDAELRAYLDQSEMRHALLEGEALRRQEPFRWMWQVWRLLTAELWLRSQTSAGLRSRPNPPFSPARVAVQLTRASYLFPS